MGQSCGQIGRPRPVRRVRCTGMSPALCPFYPPPPPHHHLGSRRMPGPAVIQNGRLFSCLSHGRSLHPQILLVFRSEQWSRECGAPFQAQCGPETLGAAGRGFNSFTVHHQHPPTASL